MTQNHDDTDAMLNEMMARGREVQNSTFRARDELLPCPFCGGDAERFDLHEGSNVGGSCISCTRCFASGAVEFGFKENFISNWNRRSANEARGAEEQRRKDAEERAKIDDIPSAYVRPEDFYYDEGDERFGPWTSIQSGKYIVPLYTRPANVAALEARVKVLEDALNSIVGSAWMVRTDICSFQEYSELCLKTARAALTREGGV